MIHDTSPALSIRHARADDAAALVALQAAIYREDHWFVGDGPPSTDSLERRLRGLKPELELLLLAGVWPPRSPASLYAWLELNRFFMAKMRHVAMLTLAVRRDHRRQGLGRALLEEAYAWAREVGAEKIQLNVRASNLPAISLYHAEGFALEGRERRQVKTAAGYEDNLVMAKFV